MKLKISCDTDIKLENMTTISNIKCSLLDYRVNEDTLRGNIKIEGIYLKEDLDKEYQFEDLVPFTVVFKDKSFTVDLIEIQNFKYNEVFNSGLEIFFDIIVSYSPADSNKAEEVKCKSCANKDKVSENNADQFDKGMEEEIDNNSFDHDSDDNENFEPDDLIQEEDVDLEDEDFKEQLTQNYSDELENILMGRNDNFLEQNEMKDEQNDVCSNNEEIEVNRIDENKEETLTQSNIFVTEVKNPKNERVIPILDTTQATYKIYYAKSERDLECVAKKENISIEKVLKKSIKDDGDVRRIIIE